MDKTLDVEKRQGREFNKVEETRREGSQRIQILCEDEFRAVRGFTLLDSSYNLITSHRYESCCHIALCYLATGASYCFLQGFFKVSEPSIYAYLVDYVEVSKIKTTHYFKVSIYK